MMLTKSSLFSKQASKNVHTAHKSKSCSVFVLRARNFTSWFSNFSQVQVAASLTNETNFAIILSFRHFSVITDFAVKKFKEIRQAKVKKKLGKII